MENKKVFTIKKDTNKVFNSNGFLYTTPYSKTDHDFMQDTENIGTQETERTIELINDYIFLNNWLKDTTRSGTIDHIKKSILEIETKLKKLHIQIILKGK